MHQKVSTAEHRRAHAANQAEKVIDVLADLTEQFNRREISEVGYLARVSILTRRLREAVSYAEFVAPKEKVISAA